MKEILDRLKAAFAKLTDRVDPHAAAHELDVLAATVHGGTLEALERLHAGAEEVQKRIEQIDALIKRVEELEAKIQAVLGHPALSMPALGEASACGPSATLPQNTDPGNSEAPVVSASTGDQNAQKPAG